MNRSIAGTGLFVFVFDPAVKAVGGWHGYCTDHRLHRWRRCLLRRKKRSAVALRSDNIWKYQAGSVMDWDLRRNNHIAMYLIKHQCQLHYNSNGHLQRKNCCFKADSESVLLPEQKPKIPPAILAFRMMVLLTHCRNRTFSVVFPQIPPMSEVRVVSRISPPELQLVKVSY